MLQALKDMDTDTLRRLLGDVNLPSWVNFPGERMQGFPRFTSHAVSNCSMPLRSPFVSLVVCRAQEGTIAML